jgi:hypothetical protein
MRSNNDSAQIVVNRRVKAQRSPGSIGKALYRRHVSKAPVLGLGAGP